MYWNVYTSLKHRKGCPQCSQRGRKPKYTHEDVRRISESRGFEPIDQYVRSDVSQRFQCLTCKYVWKTGWGNLTRSESKGCPACNGHRSQYTMDEVHETCRQKHIQCLDTAYSHGNVPMSFRCCKCDRHWTTTFRSIVQNIGCIDCTFDAKMRLTMADVESTIEGRGIKCLETKYVNSRNHMRWKCEHDHIWKTSFHHIRHSNSGCPTCYKESQPLDIEHVARTASDLGYECLDVSYTGSTVPMRWKHTQCGNVKTMTYSNVLRSGCLICSGFEKYTLEHVIATASEHGFECMESEYINNQTPMMFHCLTCSQDRVVSFSTFQNYGCGQCSRFKSERLCRDLLQSYLGHNFPKARPAWLGGLELDGYCEELGLAFEYQGKQHSEYIPHFHRTEDAFPKQQEHDQRKRELCGENDVTLVEVSHEFDFTKHDELEAYVISELVDKGYL